MYSCVIVCICIYTVLHAFCFVPNIVNTYVYRVCYYNQDGATALMAATQGGHLPIVKYLVEKGADVNKEDKVLHMKYKSMFMMCIDYGSVEDC